VVSPSPLRSLVQSSWKPPTTSEIDRHVKAAVSMFLAEFSARRTSRTR
jgi:hypothetical protein